MVADNLTEKGTGLTNGIPFLNSSKLHSLDSASKKNTISQQFIGPFVEFCLKKEHRVDPEHL